MKNCAPCNEGLALTSGEVGVRFISFLSRFDRTQGLVCGGKFGKIHLKSQLDLEAWVLLGGINAMKNCDACNEGLVTTSGEVSVRFIPFLSRFDRTQGLVCGGKVGQSHLKSRLDLEALVLPGGINAMKNCDACNEGLVTTSGEVVVRFILFLSPFDRTQGLVCGGKVALSHLKSHLDLEAWVLPGGINAMKNCAGCNE
jgi:hypothetical protein